MEGGDHKAVPPHGQRQAMPSRPLFPIPCRGRCGRACLLPLPDEVTSHEPGLSSVPGWAARLPAWARKLTRNSAGQEFSAGSAGLASCPELRGPRSQLCQDYTTGLRPSRGIAGPCTASSRRLCLALGLFCRAGHAGTSLCIWDLGCVRRQSLEIIHIYDQVLPARARLTCWYEQALTD